MTNGSRLVIISRHDPVDANTMGGIARAAGVTLQEFRDLFMNLPGHSRGVVPLTPLINPKHSTPNVILRHTGSRNC